MSVEMRYRTMDNRARKYYTAHLAVSEDLPPGRYPGAPDCHGPQFEGKTIQARVRELLPAIEGEPRVEVGIHGGYGSRTRIGVLLDFLAPLPSKIITEEEAKRRVTFDLSAIVAQAHADVLAGWPEAVRRAQARAQTEQLTRSMVDGARRAVIDVIDYMARRNALDVELREAEWAMAAQMATVDVSVVLGIAPHEEAVTAARALAAKMLRSGSHGNATPRDVEEALDAARANAPEEVRS